MNFYWFERFERFQGVQGNELFKIKSKEWEDLGFKGVLFPYSVNIGDFFVKIARNINPNENLKYIVAIRPYTISPQYISMIKQSIDEISPDRIQINFIAGHVIDHEKKFGGVFGEINDLSHWKERKKYLVEYLKTWSEMKSPKPYSYVSGGSAEIFDAVENYSDANFFDYQLVLDKVPYREINKKRVISLQIKDHQNIESVVEDIKKLGYSDIMFWTRDKNESLELKIMNFVKNYYGDKNEL